MRKMLVAMLATLLSVAFAAGERVVCPVNDGWSFRFAHQVSGRGRQVDLPHTWNAADALAGRPDYYRGMGVYERTFCLPEQWAGKRVFLRFKGANQVAAVFVDSRFVGRHKGGYGAFVMDVTDFLTPGKKGVVTVKVTNALDLEVMPLVGDFNMYGGLYRGVDLVAVDSLHISLTDHASPGVYLTPRSVDRRRARVEAAVMVSNYGSMPADARLRVRVMDGAREVAAAVVPFSVAADTMARVVADLELVRPHLWDGRRAPFLYRAVAEILGPDGVAVDSVTQPLGLRSFGVDAERGFSLNGTPTRLHGVCRHQDRDGVGNALLPEHHAEDAAIIDEIGANAVRLAHYPQAEEFYSLMDSLGIVVWAEIPFIGPGGYLDRGFNDLPEFRANGREQLIELIRQNYNHPSICFWGIFNELKTHGDNPIGYVTELNDLAHSEDSSRLTAAASFLSASDPLNGVTDLIAWNQYFGWYGGSAADLARWLDATHRDHPDYRIGLSEYGAGASVLHQQDSLKRADASGHWHPENYQTYYHSENWRAIAARPFVWASFVWNLFDFGAAHRTEGDRDGINDKGLVTFDRKVKKDAFYYYKANWNTRNPFVYIANRRHSGRSASPVEVTVFSNCDLVELSVNGRSIGRRRSDGFGTFVFPSVELAPGENILSVSAVGRGISASDTVKWALVSPL